MPTSPYFWFLILALIAILILHYLVVRDIRKARAKSRQDMKKVAASYRDGGASYSSGVEY